jgi:hypothetical protein
MSVVKDERVENAFTRPLVSLSAEPHGSGLATLGVCGRRSGFRALSRSFLQGLQRVTRGDEDDRLTVRGDYRHQVCRVVARGLKDAAAEARRQRA